MDEKEVDHFQNLLSGVAVPMRSWGVVQYGVEATLPYGSSSISQAELREMDIREERLYRRLKKYESTVYALEMAGEHLKHEKEIVIYDCLLKGMSDRAISKHLDMTRNQIKKAKDDILNQLSQRSQFVQLLNLEILVC